MSPGRLGGRYTPLVELGRGATAVVYRARDEQLRTDVAVKVLAPHLLRDPAAVGRLRRELLASRQIACDAVAAVYDLGQDEDSVFLVMEYGPTGTLKDHLLLHGPLAPAALDLLMEQLARALEACHRQGILHRDLKPSNLLFDPATSRIKLIDFGVARMAESGDSGEEGSVVGTAEYMAPEQFDDPVPDPRSDLYAAGVVLYEAATGRSPFSGRTVPEVARRHHEGLRARPREVNPALGPGAEAILLRLLARDPANRFQTAGELLEALAGGSTVEILEDDARSPGIGAGCPACGGRREPGLPFCPACGVDLVPLERFGRWSVLINDCGDTEPILRWLGSVLPEGAIRPERVDLARRPLTVIEFASEPYARWLAARLQGRGVNASLRLLGFPRAILIALFSIGALTVLALLLVFTYGQLHLWATAQSFAMASYRRYDGPFEPESSWLLAIPLLAGAVATLVLGLRRHLRRRFAGALAYVDPVPREIAVADPILRARAIQKRLQSPRLRALGTGLLASAHRRLADPRSGPDPALADLLATAFTVLEGLDRQLVALGQRNEPPATRLARQDAAVKGTQTLLRLSVLWRRRQTAAVKQRGRALGQAAAGAGPAAAEIDATRSELLEVLAELDGLAPPGPRTPRREVRA